MPYFRLKAGGHTQGVGVDQKFFFAGDPQGLRSSGNVVESDEDLAALEPERWEATNAPPKDKRQPNVEEPRAPRPQVGGPTTREEKLAKAEELEAEAKSLREGIEGDGKRSEVEEEEEEEDGLEDKNVAELREIAKNEEVEGANNLTKDRLIAAIRSGRKG